MDIKRKRKARGDPKKKEKKREKSASSSSPEDEYTQSDLLKLIAKLTKRCIEKDIFYFDVFKSHSPKGINILTEAEFETCISEIMDDEPISSKDYKIIHHFYAKKDSKKKLIKYQKLCIEMDQMKRIFEFKEPMFNNIKERLINKGITLETYLKKIDKGESKGFLSVQNLNRIMKNNDILSENGSDLRMMLILTEGKSLRKIELEDFQKIYIEITGDKASEEEEEEDDEKGIMSLREKHWAHLHFVEFQNTLKKSKEETIKDLMKESLGEDSVDERGFTGLENLKKILRKLDPAIAVDELKKVSEELKSKAKGKYSVKKLDKLVNMAGRIEEKSKENVTKNDINHEQNEDIKDMLKMFTKHCVRKKFYFRDIFYAEDNKKSGKVPFKKFMRICSDEGFTILEENVRLMKQRYQDQEEKMDYYKIEQDMIAINPRYKKFVGADKEMARQPKELLDTYIMEVSKKFPTVTDFCKTIDTRSQGKISKKSMLMYFKGLDPKLKEIELVSIFKILDTSKPKFLRYYQMKEGVKRIMQPHIRTWLGEILNKYEETKKSLGKMLMGKNSKIPSKISKDKLQEKINEYRLFDDNQFSFMLDCLEIEEDYSLRINWRKFKNKLLGMMLRYKLREEAVIKAFFSKKDLKISKEGELEGEPSKEEHIDLLIQIRLILKMIGKKQAVKRFNIVDSNHSKYIVFNEFEDFVTDLVPNADKWTIKKAYDFISGGKKEKISEKKFVDAFINKIDLQDRDEIIYESAKVYQNLFVKINKVLVKKKKDIDELLTKDKMKIYEIMDVLTLQLGIHSTQDVFKALECLVFGDEENTILTEDLKHLLRLMDERHGYLHQYSAQKIEDANELSQTLKKKFKTRKFSIHDLFQKVDSDGNEECLNFQEFYRIISFFKSGVSKIPAKILFEMIDDEDTGKISINDFMAYFDVDDIKDFEEEKKKNEIWLKDLLIELDLCVLQAGISPQKVFHYKNKRIKKKKFLEILKKIKFNKSKHYKFNEFMGMIKHEKYDKYINLGKLRYLFTSHKKDQDHNIFDESRKAVFEKKQEKEHHLTKKIDPDVEIYLFGLAEEFQNDINSILNYLDFDNSGDISKPELVIKSKKLFGEKNSGKYSEIFNKIKKEHESVISNNRLREMLVNVINKYQTTENQSFMDESLIMQRVTGLNSSFNNSILMNSLTDLDSTRNLHDIQHNVSSKEEVDLMMKLRKELNFDDEKVVKKFCGMDEKKRKKIHKKYVLKALKELGTSDLTKAQEGILFTGVKDSSGQVFYFELISKIFPFFNDKSGSVIKSIEDFVIQLKQELKIRGILSKRLFYEMKFGFSDEQSASKLKISDEISREEFTSCVQRKGYGITKRDVEIIFDELDIDKTNSVSYENFREVLFHNNNDSDFVLNKINLEIKHKGLEISDIFKIEKKGKKDNKGKEEKVDSLNFKEFLESIEKLKIEIYIVDLETLFCIIDVNNDGVLSYKELEAVFKKFDVKRNLNLNTFRKKLFVFLTKSAENLEEFLEGIDMKGRRVLNRRQFFDVLKLIGFEKAEEEDKMELFEIINKKGNYCMSFQELRNAYDESNILTLFPFVKEFKNKLKEKLKTQSKTIKIFLRKYDKNSDELISKEEFEELLNDLDIESLKDKTDKDFLWESCNLDKNETISEFEIREFLNGGKIVDVVSLVEKMKRILRHKRYDLEELFDKIDKDKSREIEFKEFEILLLTKCGFKELTFIELDEVFRFLDRDDEDSIKEDDFLEVFSDWKPLRAQKYNSKYFKDISERQRHYYEKIYKMHLKEEKGMKGYSEDEEWFHHRYQEGKKDYIDKHKNRKESDSDQRIPPSGRGKSKVQAWKQEEKKFGDTADLKKFADGIAKLLKRNKANETFEESMKNFLEGRTKRVALKGFKKLATFIKFKKSRKRIETIFNFIDIKQKGYIPLTDLQEFFNKYSYSGGDGTLVADEHLGSIELAIIGRLKRLGKRFTLKDYYNDVVKNRKEMRLKQFKEMIYDLELEGEINDQEAEKLFEYLDVNKNTSMSYKEFAAIFKDKKRLRIYNEEKKEANEVIKSITTALKKRLGKQAKNPELLFKKMDLNRSGKITRNEFGTFFEKYDLCDDDEKIDLLFEKCLNRKNSSLLNFDKFVTTVFASDDEEEDERFSRSKVCEKIKDVFLEFEEKKKGEIFDLFQEYETTSSGYWTKSDFFQFLMDYQKIILPRKTTKKDEMKLFEYLDVDTDNQISLCEFFRIVMKKEYQKSLYYKYGDHSIILNLLLQKLLKKEYEDFFDYLNSEEKMEISTKKFNQKVYKLGIDTTSKDFQRLEKAFQGISGKRNIRIGLLNDFIVFELEKGIDSDKQAEVLRKSRRFDIDAKKSKRMGSFTGSKSGWKEGRKKQRKNYREDESDVKRGKRRYRRDSYSSGDLSSDKYETPRKRKRKKNLRLSDDDEHMAESRLLNSEEEKEMREKERRKKYKRKYRSEIGGFSDKKRKSKLDKNKKPYRRVVNRWRSEIPNKSGDWGGKDDSSEKEKSEGYLEKKRKKGRDFSKIREEEEDDEDSEGAYEKDKGRYGIKIHKIEKDEKYRKKSRKEWRGKVYPSSEEERSRSRLSKNRKKRREISRSRLSTNNSKKGKRRRDRDEDSRSRSRSSLSKKNSKKNGRKRDNESRSRSRSRKRYNRSRKKDSKWSRRNKDRSRSTSRKSSRLRKSSRSLSNDSLKIRKRKGRFGKERERSMSRTSLEDLSIEKKKRKQKIRSRGSSYESDDDIEETHLRPRDRKDKRARFREKKSENYSSIDKRLNALQYGRKNKRSRSSDKENSDSSLKRRQKEKIKEIEENKPRVRTDQTPPRKPRKHLKPREKLIVDKVAANIINFMIMDNFKFSDLFGKYDYENKGFIPLDDMERAVYDDLNIKYSKNMELFIDHYLTYKGDVNIYNLRADLQKYSQGRKSKKKFVIQSIKKMEDNLSYYSRERLTAFRPPKRVNIDREGYLEIIHDLKTFFSKQAIPRLKNRDLFDYLDKEKNSKIRKKHFIKQIKKAGYEGLSEAELDKLFDFLDHNNTKVVSLNEFRYYFYEREFLEKEVKENAFSSALEDDLRELFNRIDADKSGYMDVNEFVTCLNLLGYIVTPEVIRREFNEVDRNGDMKIDYREFKLLMRRKLHTDFLKIENQVNFIKESLRKVHPKRGDLYDYGQFRVAMENMDFQLTNSEIKAMFFEVDQSNKTKIHLDDFINFILADARDIDNIEAASGILKIKTGFNLGLIELVEAYNHCPRNFCNSFTRSNFMAMSNLPSASLYPHLSRSGLYFKDIYGEWRDERLEIDYPIKPIPSQYIGIFELIRASGVPIPEENLVNRKANILSRELRICIFNQLSGEYIGNSLTYQATWKRDYEDRWYFRKDKFGKKEFLLRLAEFDERSSSGVILVFEFVMYFVHKNVELQMSCGWASVEISSIMQSGEMVLAMKGGSPKANIGINPNDIRAGRKTFLGKMGKFMGSKVKSELRIKIAMERKVKKNIKEMSELLPKVSLSKMQSIYIQRAFRSYLGRNAILKGGINPNIATDVVTKTFLRCTNLSTLEEKVSDFWNKNIETKIVDYEELIDQISKMMRHLYLMFQDEKFEYNRNDQTLEYYSKPRLISTRNKLIDAYLRSYKHELKGKKMIIPQDQTEFKKTFDITELMEDDFNFDF